MSKYSPGSGPYEVRFGYLDPASIPSSFEMDEGVYKRHEKQFQFYSRLEESIKREGFRNPVMMYEKPGERTFPYGGSRVYTARRLQVPVPAIVSDWVGTFSHWELITTVDQALSKFKDIPTVLEFHPELGCQFWGCRQTQLDPNGQEHFSNWQFKNNRAHLERRLTTGQYYYADLGIKVSK